MPWEQKMDFKYCSIILGCPRSGTTFLVECLKALPKSEVVSGNLFPVPLAHIVNQNLAPEITTALMFSLEFSIKDYLESISSAKTLALYRWFTRSMSNLELIHSLLGKRQIRHFIYKEPFLAFAPQYTYDALPNCQIIHIYRDGRDCADSLIRRYDVLTDQKLMSLTTAEAPLGRKYDHRYVPWWVDEGQEEEFLDCTPYLRAVWMWKEMVKRCNQHFSRLDVKNSGRVMLLKYEDLVQYPEKLGEEVVHHIYGEMNHRLLRRFQKARTSSSGVYKRRDMQEIRRANQIAGNELKLYGYL